jgi:hypothetical protein
LRDNHALLFPFQILIRFFIGLDIKFEIILVSNLNPRLNKIPPVAGHVFLGWEILFTTFHAQRYFKDESIALGATLVTLNEDLTECPRRIV